MNRVFAAATVSLLVFTGCSKPAPAPLHSQVETDANIQAAARQIIMRYDTNNDGKLSEIEFAQAMLALFESLDTNRDNKLTKAELGPNFNADAMKRADKDKDGKLSLQEALEDLDALFQERDLNHDGYLSVEEIEVSIRNKSPMPAHSSGEGETSR